MQLQAKEVIERELNPDQTDPSFVVALEFGGLTHLNGF